MQETEITVRVFEDSETVQKMLLKKGFVVLRKYTMIDYYFTHMTQEKAWNSSYIDMLNNSILVRHVIENGEMRTQLCYKKKQMDSYGNVVGEEKFRTGVDNLQGALDVLSMSGLYRWCELRNDSVVLGRGSDELAIQAIEGLGTFIEYEENSRHSGMQPEEKFDSLKAFVDGLGLPIGSDYSCKKVFMKYHSIQA